MMSPTPDSLVLAERVATGLSMTCQLALTGYSLHRWPMVLVAHAPGPATPLPWWSEADTPAVLVQLPVRDEPTVVERLVAAAAALDWPRDRLEIQLLDDSGAACAARGAAAVAIARDRGVRAVQLRRDQPHGWKAGALADGLSRSEAEFVAVFDADFVPPADFLRRLLPHFASRDVGMVQARWGHLNRDASLLTRAQAVLLDAHQRVEHGWRQRAGRFFNFNGTAGVWRRACIEQAGGWQHDMLTEDLDLSYRAQLAGWRFVFDPSVVVPAELPEDMSALRSQQRRWTRGALQTARKLLPAVWRSPTPWRVKFEATVHLTANANYPLLLALALLTATLIARAGGRSAPQSLAVATLLFAAGTLPLVAFLALGAHPLRGRAGKAAVDVAGALLLSAGLSWHLTRAVFEGLLAPTGEFVRTPKSGTSGGRARARTAPPRRARRSEGTVELALSFALGLAAAGLAARGDVAGVPVLAALALGLAWVGAGARRPMGG